MMNMDDSLSSAVARLRKMVEEKKRKLDRWEEERDPKRRRTVRAIGKDETPKLVHPALLVLRLDEIDDDGKVKVKAQSLTTLKVNINRQKKDQDPRVGMQMQMQGINTNKNILVLRRKPKLFLSVEESIDLRLRLRSQFGQAKDINPNLMEELGQKQRRRVEESSIPHVGVDKVDDDVDVEWWDVPFLQEEEENMKKMVTIYVEHPRPIQPPAAAAPPTSQPLKLTKHERNKLRTLKRVARHKDIQHMIRLGVLAPPKPRLKITNIIKSVVAPTKVEMEITRAAAEREQAHVDRNIARKLTPAERHQKKARKLFDDESHTIVSVYKINADLCHRPQARFKVDTNAQQNRLTGCAATIINSDKGITSSVVVVEGCNKSIKRFRKLMLQRIDWTATDEDENDDNKCQLVWEGSVAQPNFSRFMLQGSTEAASARKFFSDHGVAHYLDLALNFDDYRSHN